MSEIANDNDADRQVIGGMLHSIEFLLEAAQGVKVIAEQLVAVHRSGKQLAPSTLAHYDEQLAAFDKHRDRMWG